MPQVPPLMMTPTTTPAPITPAAQSHCPTANLVEIALVNPDMCLKSALQLARRLATTEGESLRTSPANFARRPSPQSTIFVTTLTLTMEYDPTPAIPVTRHLQLATPEIDMEINVVERILQRGSPSAPNCKRAAIFIPDARPPFLRFRISASLPNPSSLLSLCYRCIIAHPLLSTICIAINITLDTHLYSPSTLANESPFLRFRRCPISYFFSSLPYFPICYRPVRPFLAPLLRSYSPMESQTPRLFVRTAGICIAISSLRPRMVMVEKLGHPSHLLESSNSYTEPPTPVAWEEDSPSWGGHRDIAPLQAILTPSSLSCTSYAMQAVVGETNHTADNPARPSTYQHLALQNPTTAAPTTSAALIANLVEVAEPKAPDCDLCYTDARGTPQRAPTFSPLPISAPFLNPSSLLSPCYRCSIAHPARLYRYYPEYPAFYSQ
ncbi:hypothetical protein C8J57DRAFT_631298 [Mycena rebaudengoi]|nr:hypothetical protein C8J57DRAFT_631298 [Mycena rebaudengoi]